MADTDPASPADARALDTTALPSVIPPSPSLNILPSNQSVVNNSASSLPSPILPSATLETKSSSINVPLRHPQPMTAADLYAEVEKEQEALVNRLTRELSLLRTAQNASVLSTTSSTSAGATGPDPTPGFGSSPSIPISQNNRYHHRTASNASQSGILGSSYEARRLSRRSSNISRRSFTEAPDILPQPQQQRLQPLMGSHPAYQPSSIVATPGSSYGGGQLSPALLSATLRYEETAHYRAELESAKRENEQLKQRIRELERLVRDTQPPRLQNRPRSDSVSTTASVSAAGGGVGIAGPRERGQTTPSVAGSVGVGVPDEEVQVGESAAGGGVRP